MCPDNLEGEKREGSSQGMANEENRPRVIIQGRLLCWHLASQLIPPGTSLQKTEIAF